jgi:tetratricopeptide (TPR) repeat protein
VKLRARAFLAVLIGCLLLAVAHGQTPAAAPSPQPQGNFTNPPADNATAPAGEADTANAQSSNADGQSPTADAKGSAAAAEDQPQPTALVLPFNNRSSNTNLDWIGEAFVESISGALRQSGIATLSREERAEIFDQNGIPLLPTLSLATLIHVAGDVDARWLITGSFDNRDGAFTASADIVDLKRDHLEEVTAPSGRLEDLQSIQARLAWEILRRVNSDVSTPLDQFIAAQPRVGITAYENYIRGLIAGDPQVQLKYFRAAARLQPDYSPAMFQLGQWYLDNEDPAAAVGWFLKIGRSDAHYWEARFLAGLAAFRAGEFGESATLYRTIAEQFPIPEVLNNLALAASRDGAASSPDSLERAVAEDGSDPDLRVNLAVCRTRLGDLKGAIAAVRGLRTGEQTGDAPTGGDAADAGHDAKDDSGKPSSNELSSDELSAAELSPAQAKFIELLRAGKRPDAASLAAAETLKSDFPADVFVQLQQVVTAFNDTRAEQLPPDQRPRFYTAQGDELLAKGAEDAAEREYRQALQIDASDAAAHAGLARIFAERNQWPRARAEAQLALKSGPNSNAYLVLARALLAEGKADEARTQAVEALRLDPNSAPAQQLVKQLTGAQQ